MGGPRLVLHLGMPKTGTSLLQNTLSRLQDGPGAAALIYPAHGRGGGVAHHALAQAVQAGDPEAEADALRAAIAEEAARAPAARVAFCSSEAFTNLCGISVADRFARFAERLGAGGPVQSVIVIREFADFMESMYLQSARFGNMKLSFDAYVGSRKRWAGALFEGLLELRRRLGPAFEITFQDPGFNVIEHFADRLDLPRATLAGVAEGVASTAKRSLKQQVAMTFLPELEADLGIPVLRRHLVGLFESGFAFADDAARFTLYAPGAHDAQRALFCQIAEDHGFDAYADRFRDRRARPAPTREIAYKVLTGADRAALRQALERRRRTQKARG